MFAVFRDVEGAPCHLCDTLADVNFSCEADHANPDLLLLRVVQYDYYVVRVARAQGVEDD